MGSSGEWEWEWEWEVQEVGDDLHCPFKSNLNRTFHPCIGPQKVYIQNNRRTVHFFPSATQMISWNDESFIVETLKRR